MHGPQTRVGHSAFRAGGTVSKPTSASSPVLKASVVLLIWPLLGTLRAKCVQGAALFDCAAMIAGECPSPFAALHHVSA